MSTLARAARRAHAGRKGRRNHSAARCARLRASRRLVLMTAVLPLAVGLTIGTALAEPSPTVSRLSGDEAERLGTAVELVARPDLAVGLVEVRTATGAGVARSTGADRLLALRAGGQMAALARKVGPDPTALVLARHDGSQLLVPLPGLLSAAFAPDGTWLAALDGSGSLWRVMTDSGSAVLLAAGPFIGAPIVEETGSVVILSVPSVEAPFMSRLVRVAADGSATTALSDDQLVYGAQQLAGGGLAVIAHQPSGTLVWRLAGGSRQLLVDLGRDAVNAAVSDGAGAVAWERAGEIFAQSLPDGQPVRLATGSQPRLAPDGQAVLVELPTGTALFALDGRSLGTLEAQAAFASCPAGCGS